MARNPWTGRVAAWAIPFAAALLGAGCGGADARNGASGGEPGLGGGSGGAGGAPAGHGGTSARGGATGSAGLAGTAGAAAGNGGSAPASGGAPGGGGVTGTAGAAAGRGGTVGGRADGGGAGWHGGDGGRDRRRGSGGGPTGTGGSAGTTGAPGGLVNTYDGARASTLSFDLGWKFHLGDVSGAQGATFDDSGWTALDVPHDWSIALPFNQSSPSKDGGGYLDGGLGWYRKTFTLPASSAAPRVLLQFDGVYMDTTVYLNGTQVCARPYGYASFECDITSGGKLGASNVVAVKVNNQQPSSRWYSGSGIYATSG